jgi:hypothetical protein
MEIEEKEIIENYYVDMKEQDEDTVELEVYLFILGSVSLFAT